MNDLEINKSIIVLQPSAFCFDLWTTNEGIQKFFAKNCNVELRVGGAFEMYFIESAPKGGQGSEGCKILSYIPNEMLSFSWNAPPHFPDIRNGSHYTWVVLTFNPHGTNETQVRLRHLGWPEGDQWMEVYNYFNSAWDRVLESFKTACVEKG